MAPQLRICSIADNWFVGELDLKDVPKAKESFSIETIIILDRSGSMSGVFRQVVEVLLPQALLRLQYKPDDPVTLITFESAIQVYETTVDGLSKLNIDVLGATYMAGVFGPLQKKLCSQQGAYRVLAISDGDLYDQKETVKESLQISEIVQASGLRVSAQAVRYFTSGCQPDTRGLASILQLNTVSQPNLLDLANPHSDINSEIAAIASLFEDDGIGYCTMLEADNSCFLRDPWDTTAVPTLAIANKSTGPLVWMQAIPQNPCIGDTPVEIVHGDRLDLENSSFLERTIRAHIQTAKVCHVVGNDKLAGNVSRYLHRLESALQANCPPDDGSSQADPLLTGRLMQLRKMILRRQKSVFCELAQLNNQDKVSKLNSLQQANYLRTVQQSKNARGLAKIALGGETDFAAVVHKEVESMAAHLHELQDIDDTSHQRSFYCQGTTLEGIRAVCQLMQDEVVQQCCELNDLLTMLNIVGLACHTPYGDYPDPMTWRACTVFPCFVSVADIIAAKSLIGSALQPPGVQGCDITNVIPITDDPCVHQFLLQYAPTTLELVSGYGMRQILAVVPRTYIYTICGGIWRLVQEIRATNLQFHREQLKGLLDPYLMACGAHFDHVIPFVLAPPDGQRSFYLGNNGATNLIAPLIKVHQQHGKYPSHLPAILRALYAMEVYQLTKKWYKAENKLESIDKALYDLLSIDLTQHATPLGELFAEITDEPEHYGGYSPNFNLVDSYASRFEMIAHLPFLPSLLADPLQAPVDTDIAVLYGLEDMSFQEFHFYNIVQSLLFGDKAHRVGDNAMLIDDVGIKECAHKMCSSYVKAQYAKQYASHLKARKREEQEVIARQLVDEILHAPDMNRFTHLLRSGLTISKVSHTIQNPSSIGYSQLLEGLLSVESTVPEHLPKLWCLVTGKDSLGNVVWNNGNCLFVDMARVQGIYEHADQMKAFEALSKYYEANRHHRYRAFPNRHSHGNPKPSYWAFGYKTIEAFQATVGTERWAEYCSVHCGCCGLPP